MKRGLFGRGWGSKSAKNSPEKKHKGKESQAPKAKGKAKGKEAASGASSPIGEAFRQLRRRCSAALLAHLLQLQPRGLCAKLLLQVVSALHQVSPGHERRVRRYSSLSCIHTAMFALLHTLAGLSCSSCSAQQGGSCCDSAGFRGPMGSAGVCTVEWHLKGTAVFNSFEQPR